jgi:hypothetical protein
LTAVDRNGGAWWPIVRAWQGGASSEWADEPLPDPDLYVHRTYAEEEVLPWDFIDHGISKRFLLAERRKAFLAVQTPPCDTSTCRVCGACP